MSNELGFTLIELLIVLTLKLLMFMLVVPLVYSDVSQREMDMFLTELEADVERVQINNYQTNKAYILYFNKNNYTVIKNSTQQLIKRIEYPKGVTINRRILNQVIYQKNGTLQKPGHIIFTQGKRSYKLIFPLGKGGFYIDSA